jgi:hypothetical protein
MPTSGLSARTAQAGGMLCYTFFEASVRKLAGTEHAASLAGRTGRAVSRPTRPSTAGNDPDGRPPQARPLHRPRRRAWPGP